MPFWPQAGPKRLGPYWRPSPEVVPDGPGLPIDSGDLQAFAILAG